MKKATKFLFGIFTFSILISSMALAQDAGIFQTYIVINSGSNTYYAGGANSDGGTIFNGADLGDFNSSGTLAISGGEIKSFKNNGGDVTGAKMYYRIYETSSPSGSFTELDLPFDADLGNGDQRWDELSANVDVLASLTTTANYTIEVWWKITTNVGDKFDSNFGNNFKATFDFNNTVSTSVSLTGSAGYRLLSSPITTSYSDVLDEIWTQGATTGADVTNGDPNVFTWDNTSTGDANSNWDGVTDLSGNITSGEGFLVYVYADDDYDDSDDAFPKTLSVSGTENTAGATPTINSNGDGWTLLGNPFATTIDFDNLTTDDITGVAYVWDDASSEWKTYPQQSGLGDLTDGLIAPFQGFFVQTTSSPTSASVEFPSGAKSTGGSFYGKTSESLSYLRLNVEGAEVSNSAWIQLSAKGSATSKVMGDAVELQPLSPKYAQLGFLKGDEVMDIANVAATEEIMLPVEFNTTEGGTFTITATDFVIPGDVEVLFHDYQMEVSMRIDGEFSYSFETVKLKKQDVPALSMLTAGAMKAKSTEANRFGITIRPTSVSNETVERPAAFALEQNYPNPFNPSTTISYSVQEAGAVTISVYNLMGQKVATLVDETKAAGQYNVRWNAAGAASGMYYYRLEAGGQSITRKMTLIK